MFLNQQISGSGKRIPSVSEAKISIRRIDTSETVAIINDRNFLQSLEVSGWVMMS